MQKKKKKNQGETSLFLNLMLLYFIQSIGSDKCRVKVERKYTKQVLARREK